MALSDTASIVPPARQSPALTAVAVWLDQPISVLFCVTGWLLATVVFYSLIAFLGGPSQSDTYESVFSTWVIAHGQVACAFSSGFKVVAPLYPLISGAASALVHIGRSSPFPTGAVRGPSCDRAFLAVNQWSRQSDAIDATVKIGYLAWLALMGGVIAFLRAAGRGRRRWEPATLLFVAVLPPVWMCIERTFHPEDLIAVGLSFGAAAAARRGAWWGAGILIALAVLSQQSALLVAVPLLVLAPANRQRLTYLLAAVATIGAVLLPLVLAGSRGATHAAVFGTGTTGGVGGTLLWELNLHGTLLVLFSRILPIVLSGVLAWWAVRRFSYEATLQPMMLASLIAVSFGFRLVFEQQLFGYYYMALSVSLVLLCVAEGRIREPVVAWLAALSLAYNEPLPSRREDLITLGLVVIAFALLFFRGLLQGFHWTDLIWAGLLVVAIVTFKSSGLTSQPPAWLWQVLFVPTGLLLAASPLLPLIDVVRREGFVRVRSSG